MSSFFRCCYGDSKPYDGVAIDHHQQSHEGSLLGLKVKLIKKACALAFKAHKSSKYYIHEKKKKNSSTEADVIVISFPGFWDATDWFVSNSKPYGVTKMNHRFFPSLKSIGHDETALVNEAFQLRFESILRNSSLEYEVNHALATGKQIVFTGHSSGAAVAILATLWTLEQCLNRNKNQNHKPPFCVTFGSPLVGNHILCHATMRENWSQHFTHFVTRFDIVPRIFLAPYSSIEPKFGSILEFLNPIPKSKPSTNDSSRDSESSEFYSSVMRNAATVTSYAVSDFKDSTNMLLEVVSGLVDLSPYRPFGTFIFCAKNRQLIVIRNSDAVLQLLFHSALPSDWSQVSDIAKKSILQHLNYEAELQDSLKPQNVVHLDQLAGLPLTSDGSNSDISTISTALDGLEVSARARLCLRAAGERQKQKHANEEKMRKEIKEKALASMKDLEEYKETCGVNMCYYDAFKVHKEARDCKANVKRLVLAGVWDEIIEMLRRQELPDEFEGRQEWIELGTMYRTLVEPLDIANYYRHLKDKDGGPYLDKGRPRRYRFTQRWLEHASDRRRVVEEEVSYSKSCFWAEVEELWNIIANGNKSNYSFEGGVKERVVRLEAQIKTWFERKELDKDVLLEGSTLVKWWQALPSHHKQESCIRSLIEM